MDVFNQVGTALGRAELVIAKNIGQVVGFTHRAALPTPLWITLIDYKVSSDENPSGRRLEVTDATFLVPVQGPAFSGVSGFSGTSTIFPSSAQKPITVGDRIEWPVGSQRYFFVLQDGMECIHNGYAYMVKAQHQKSLTIGQHG